MQSHMLSDILRTFPPSQELRIRRREWAPDDHLKTTVLDLQLDLMAAATRDGAAPTDHVYMFGGREFVFVERIEDVTRTPIKSYVEMVIC